MFAVKIARWPDTPADSDATRRQLPRIYAVALLVH